MFPSILIEFLNFQRKKARAKVKPRKDQSRRRVGKISRDPHPKHCGTENQKKEFPRRFVACEEIFTQNAAKR
jgi:hypothetical protein